jgi:putative ABC transport system ATP-binding protein
VIGFRRPAERRTSDAGVGVVVERVSKLYERGTSVLALSDVTLTAAPGSLTAIMGPSGSGKSTLLNLIGGLDVPTSGSIRVGGAHIAAMTERARSALRRTELAYVFQAYHLLPTLTCAENVALPLHLQGLRARDARDRVERALEDVGLSDRATHLPDQLSGGERQRTAIARALVTSPRLLLADEPTGNLDSASGDQVLAVLRRVSESRGATLIMVTHSDRAAAICDSIVHLRDGRVERQDAAAPLAVGHPAIASERLA